MGRSYETEGERFSDIYDDLIHSRENFKTTVYTCG